MGRGAEGREERGIGKGGRGQGRWEGEGRPPNVRDALPPLSVSFFSRHSVVESQRTDVRRYVLEESSVQYNSVADRRWPGVRRGVSDAGITARGHALLHRLLHLQGPQRFVIIIISFVVPGLDWPLCHCAMAQAPPPSTNTGAPWPHRIFLIIIVTISVDRQHYR